jgi:hexosaminidase
MGKGLNARRTRLVEESLMRKAVGRVVCFCLVWTFAAFATAQEAPALVPWPKCVEMKPGALDLGPQSRIVVAEERLLPLARILAEEIQAVAEVRLATAQGEGNPGDIVLTIDPGMKGEQHVVEVGERAVVRGGNYAAVALGTVTLLQSIQHPSGKAALPRMRIADEPALEYRGLMVDVARQYHSIVGLERIVELCRLYKIRYLQLHLTDDQSFMFPSKAYPQLAAQNQHGGKTYTLAELKGLVAFADARNVTIVPEYEVPGHSAAANRALPDLFVIRRTKPYEHHASINFAKDEVMKAVATIVGEMCEVFRSSPYFHIGGDEADLALANQNVEFQAAFKKYGLPNQHQLYRKFVVDMNEIVKRNGKQMIVWEGFGRELDSPIAIPKDVLVMAYEIRFYMPDALIRDGYQVINASWTPLYVVNDNRRPPEEIYAWQPRQFKPFGAKPEDRGIIVPPRDKVFGAQMCTWEQPEKAELPSLRGRLPAMAERAWNTSAGKDSRDFVRRQALTDGLLSRLIGEPKN